MLPKQNRLNLYKDFKWVTGGKKVETPLVTLFIKTGDNLFPRIGIAVSVKKLKKAADRNRARRLVSKAFESLYGSLPKDINIVALPKSRVINVKSDAVLLDLKSSLSYEKIIS